MAEIAAEGEPTTSAGHPETQSPTPDAKGGVVPRTPRASARNAAPTSAYRDVLRREWDPRHRLRPRLGHSHFVKNLRLVQRLDRHAGCVNTVAWSEDASLLLSGSDDLCVCVWSVGTSFPCLGTVYTGHNHNIFSAEFVPGTRGGRCVTTAGDGDVRVVDLVRGFQSAARSRGDPRASGRSPFRTRRFGFDDDDVNDGAARSLFAGRPTDPNELGDVMGMKVRFVPGSPDVVLATHQDGRVRRFDLRQAPRATGDVVVDLSVQGGCSDLAFDPSSPSLFALGCDDPFVRIFDVRHLAETPAAGASSRRRARSPSEREHGDLIPVVAKYSPGKSHGFNSRSLRFDGVSGLAYGTRGELAVTYRGEHLYVIDQRAYESRRLATFGDGHGNGHGDGHGNGHGNGHGVGAADAGTEWGSLFGAGGAGSPPPAGSESPEFGYASPDTSGFGSGGSDSDSDSGSDAGSESDADAEDGAAGARRSVSVPRDRVLSPGGGWDLFDDDPTHRPMERDDSAVRQYVGHRNVKTFLKSVAFMCDDAYVSTGSDCGGMFVWDARTCELVLKVQADSQVVNNVCPHPSLPMVVTSGIDDCMRVWEGGDGRHLIDLPEKYPDDDDDFDDDDDYDDLDEPDVWGDGSFRVPFRSGGDDASFGDAESSSSDDEDEENESDDVHDPEEEGEEGDGGEEAVRSEGEEPSGALAGAEAVRSESDENGGGSPGDDGCESAEPSAKKQRARP